MLNKYYLSVLRSISGPVLLLRAMHIKAQAWDRTGQPIKLTAEGNDKQGLVYIEVIQDHDVILLAIGIVLRRPFNINRLIGFY